jgi:hypothetical protein
MSSFETLRAYLDAGATFTHEEFALMRTVFIPSTVRAGELVQRPASSRRSTPPSWPADACAAT